MVDFNRMLRRSRIWKEIKKAQGCGCASELPISCYGLRHDAGSEPTIEGQAELTEVVCICPCHALADRKSRET